VPTEALSSKTAFRQGTADGVELQFLTTCLTCNLSLGEVAAANEACTEDTAGIGSAFAKVVT